MDSVYTAEFCIACTTVTTDKMTHTFIPSWSVKSIFLAFQYTHCIQAALHKLLCPWCFNKFYGWTIWPYNNDRSHQDL